MIYLIIRHFHIALFLVPFVVHSQTLNQSIAKYGSFSTYKSQGSIIFDGNGTADIFWRQEQSGQSCIFLMNGLSIQSQGCSTSVSPAWQVKR